MDLRSISIENFFSPTEFILMFLVFCLVVRRIKRVKNKPDKKDMNLFDRVLGCVEFVVLLLLIIFLAWITMDY